MAILKAKYENVDDIPERYRELFDPDTGALKPIPGAVPESVVDEMQDELSAERERHKLTKARAWDKKGRPGSVNAATRREYESLLDGG